MTASSDTKRCRKCGASFTRSRTDATVNCPACRKPQRKPAACAACGGTRWITYGPSAVSGEFDTVPCHRCNS